MTRAFVGMGSNRDDPPARLDAACEALDALPGCRVTGRSRRYWTEPVGDTEQPQFLNAVVALDTEQSASSLLHAMQRIELEQGRVRDPARRWGPRSLDLDLLVFGDQVIESPDLTLPHPRLHERAFVLRPLADLDADLWIPGRGVVHQLLECLDVSGVHLAAPDSANGRKPGTS